MLKYTLHKKREALQSDYLRYPTTFKEKKKKTQLVRFAGGSRLGINTKQPARQTGIHAERGSSSFGFVRAFLPAHYAAA